MNDPHIQAYVEKMPMNGNVIWLCESTCLANCSLAELSTPECNFPVENVSKYMSEHDFLLGVASLYRSHSPRHLVFAWPSLGRRRKTS